MRRPLLAVAAAALLALPVGLAFFHGGYGADARVAGGVVAWLLVAVAAIAAPRPLPRDRPALLAVTGLAALLALTLLSLAWAPLAAVAYADAQRIALYLGALLAGLALFRAAPGPRVVVPALAAGAVVVVLVGLSERLAPWLVELERSASAGGRLSAPLGYWNAMGAMAAMGLALCAALAGDPDRAARTRALAAAATPLLGAGIALTFSRGALLAAAAALVTIALARPSPAQWGTLLIAGTAAVVGGVVAALLPAVADLSGSDSTRAVQGAVLAGVLVAVGAAAALAPRLVTRRAAAKATIALPRPRLLATAVVAVVVAGVGLLVALEAGSDDPAFGATAERLGSVQSNRYEYWRVAVTSFADDPLLGTGSGAFQVEWLRERTIASAARDAHSLPLETAAELGIAGLLALALLVAGIVAGATRRRAEPAAYGALVAWAVHVCIDWGWEMPTVTLFAVLLGAAVLAGEGVRRETSTP
jgi:O-antigen ligase